MSTLGEDPVLAAIRDHLLAILAPPDEVADVLSTCPSDRQALSYRTQRAGGAACGTA